MDMLPKLSLEEKISLLTGADYWTLHGHPGIGLRPIRTSDGPAGVRGPRWDERDTALNVPAPVALAATWDPHRAELIGSLENHKTALFDDQYISTGGQLYELMMGHDRMIADVRSLTPSLSGLILPS